MYVEDKIINGNNWTEPMVQFPMQEAIVNWCRQDDRVNALFLVGSYARGKQKPDSDIDLVIITDQRESLLALDWIERFGKVDRYMREEYGACTSIRVFYKNGTEIEYGLVENSWLDSPLDPGSRKVLEDGYWLLYGSKGIDQERIKSLL